MFTDSDNDPTADTHVPFFAARMCWCANTISRLQYFCQKELKIFAFRLRRSSYRGAANICVWLWLKHSGAQFSSISTFVGEEEDDEMPYRVGLAAIRCGWRFNVGWLLLLLIHWFFCEIIFTDCMCIKENWNQVLDLDQRPAKLRSLEDECERVELGGGGDVHVAYLFRFQCCPVSDSRVLFLTIDRGGEGTIPLEHFRWFVVACCSQNNKTISLAFVLQRSGGEAVVAAIKVFVDRRPPELRNGRMTAGKLEIYIGDGNCLYDELVWAWIQWRYAWLRSGRRWQSTICLQTI